MVQRGRGWKVGVLCMLIIYVGMAICVLADATHPSGYLGAHLDGRPWVYPIDDVRFALTAMTIEILFVVLVFSLRMRFSIGARAALCAGLYFCTLFFFAPFAMHASMPFGDHLVYLLFGIAFLVVFAIGSAVAAIVTRHRKPLLDVNGVFD
jgi:hypothetical protein